ncbi:DUF3093 family protein [Microbacterium sp. YY-01]|uniref:DUF3093 family protein n=1 Tax=Microbacterium sp. YY-01 TaxID=3421634 RepID=UPI003D1626A1
MQNPEQPVRPVYREHLTPSLWALLAAAIAGPMVTLSFIPVGAAIAMTLGFAATVAIIVLFVALSPRVAVVGSTLYAGRAHIDVRWLGQPRVLTGDEARAGRGHQLSARGWHLIRGGIDGLVVIPNVDSHDPVDTWTISSRTPDRLAAAIIAAQQASSSERYTDGTTTRP